MKGKSNARNDSQRRKMGAGFDDSGNGGDLPSFRRVASTKERSPDWLTFAKALNDLRNTLRSTWAYNVSALQRDLQRCADAEYNETYTWVENERLRKLIEDIEICGNICTMALKGRGKYAKTKS